MFLIALFFGRDRGTFMEILLRKSTIKDYNVNFCKEKVEEILTEYIRVKYSYADIISKGEEFYNSATVSNCNCITSIANINYSDRIGNKVCFKIFNEQEAFRIKNDIDELYKKFTDQEKDYFDYVLLNRQPQRIVEDKYEISRGGLEIIKQSCIVKSAMHFDVAVRK